MTGHSDLYVQLHRAGVPTPLASAAANIQNHAGVPPGLLDILAAVVAAVNARCERLEALLDARERHQVVEAISREMLKRETD